MLRRLLATGTAVTVLVVILIITIALGRGKSEEKENEGKKEGAAPVPQSVEKTDSRPEAEGAFGQTDAGTDDGEKTDQDADESAAADQEETADTGRSGSYVPGYEMTEDTVQPGEEIVSSYAIFVDAENGTVLSERNGKTRMVPASMTKVLTLLVAVEHTDNLDDTYTVTEEVAGYCFQHDCSGAGFERDETVTVRDLLYGAILPSGADAALGLAMYVAGSQEAFVELMNQKLEELGIAESAHFTNCIGNYEENHYCTAYDMAVIMGAAVENEVCREVMSAHTYTTSRTEQHPEGILLSNWFLRRIEDKDTGGEVICGKTGYVNESGNCAVSYGVGENGGTYICVTANALNKWKCINDHAALYKEFGEIT